MKQYSTACIRNEEPIAEVLSEVIVSFLPASPVRVLEIGSGTGQHGVAFGVRFPELLWQPTNPRGALESVEAWRKEAGLMNLLPALEFDLLEEGTSPEPADLVVAINVVHIAPFEATEALFRRAPKLLRGAGAILLYGPFRYRERELEPSNVEFDLFLRQRDSRSGLRVFEEVNELAGVGGFVHQKSWRLPANNDAHLWTYSDQ